MLIGTPHGIQLVDCMDRLEKGANKSVLLGNGRVLKEFFDLKISITDF